MIRTFLAALLALAIAAPSAMAQQAVPQMGIDKTGSCRTLSIYDATKPGADKMVPLFCIDTATNKVRLPSTAIAPVAELGFWTDTGDGANIVRLRDRVFVGDAADIIGGKTAPASGQKTWVGNAPSGYMTYLETRSQMPVFSTIGAVAMVGASRSSDNLQAGELNTIGQVGFALNDNANNADKKSAWAFYGHAAQTQANKFTAAMELDTANLVSDVPIGPYSMAAAGASATGWFGVGGEIAQGLVASGDTATPKGVSAAIGIINSAPSAAGNRYLKGIVFQSNALSGADGTTGTGIAMEMAKGHEIAWKFSSGANAYGGKIRSDNASAAQQSRLVFGGTGLQVRGVSNDLVTETTLFRVAAPQLSAGQSTNNLYVAGQAWAGGIGDLVLGAEGAAADIQVNLRGKGTGAVNIQDGSGNNKIAVSTAGVSISGVTALVGPAVDRLFPSIQYATPSSGDTVAIAASGANRVKLVLRHSATIGSATISFPVCDHDGQSVELRSRSAITSTTLVAAGGYTISGAANLEAADHAAWECVVADSAWYRAE